MLQVTFRAAGPTGPAWDRGIRAWCERADEHARRLVVITPQLDLRGPDAAAGRSSPVWALLDGTLVDPGALLVVGPERLLEGQTTSFGELLRRHVGLVPRAVLEGRDGLPAVRRALARRHADEIGLVLDASAADDMSLAAAAVGVARAVADPARNGGARLTVLVVLGWPAPSGQGAPARRDLVARILRIALDSV